MQWQCTLPEKEDVVVNNPREAREWMNANNIPGNWRQNFEPKREETVAP